MNVDGVHVAPARLAQKADEAPQHGGMIGRGKAKRIGFVGARGGRFHQAQQMRINAARQSAAMKFKRQPLGPADGFRVRVDDLKNLHASSFLPRFPRTASHRPRPRIVKRLARSSWNSKSSSD